MELNTKELLETIEAYIAKADKDLEEQLDAEGFVAAHESVEVINSIEDKITEAVQIRFGDIVEALSNTEQVEEFLKTSWETIQNSDELKERIREIFYEEFKEMLGSFTSEWIAQSGQIMSEIYTEEPSISAPTYDFISTWSERLSEIMHLSTNKQIEKILRRANDEGLSIDNVSELISDAGIRDAGYRARRVATTEVLRVQSYTHQEAMLQDPLVYKKRWRHVLNANPRTNHMLMHGQEVFKRETFSMPGKNGGTYSPMCPRDTSLPPEESINCHCMVEAIKHGDPLGMTKEELKASREQAMSEVDAEWAMNHKSDKVEIIKSMNESDQIRFFGGKKDGKARLALVQSGVIDTDDKLRNMYKVDADGKWSLKSLQELSDDGIFTVSDKTASHSAFGDFTRPNKIWPDGRLKRGGHSQAAMDECDRLGIEFNVTKTFSNGVRVGNIPSSEHKWKRTGDGMSWFPESWDEEKIRIAGTAVANNGEPFVDGRKTGVYDGVAVRVLCFDDKTIDTICPDNDQSDFVKGEWSNG